MSINIPDKLSKQDYNRLINYLKDNELTKYTEFIKENYKN